MRIPTTAKSKFDKISMKQALQYVLAYANSGTSPNDERFKKTVRAFASRLRELPDGERAKFVEEENQYRTLLKKQDLPYLWWESCIGMMGYNPDEFFYVVNCALAHDKHKTSTEDVTFQQCVRVVSYHISQFPASERANFAEEESQFHAMLQAQDHPDLWLAAFYNGVQGHTPDKARYAIKSALAHAKRETPPTDVKFMDAVYSSLSCLTRLPEAERTKLAEPEKQLRAMLKAQNHLDLWSAAFNGAKENSPDKALYAIKCALRYAKQGTSPNFKGFQKVVSKASSCLGRLPKDSRKKLAGVEEQFNYMLETQASPQLINVALEGFIQSGAEANQNHPYAAMLTRLSTATKPPSPPAKMPQNDTPKP